MGKKLVMKKMANNTLFVSKAPIVINIVNTKYPKYTIPS